MSSLFRHAGDVLFDSAPPVPGQVCNVELKKFSETCNFLQYLKPLTPERPYFFAKIRALGRKSEITLGIAGPDISDEAHPGHWNNSVGYHNSTGSCYSSHILQDNVKGEKIGIGDVFGVQVTYFGKEKSAVLFLKNGIPVASRYLFESDHSKFLPTIALENGPVDLGLMWPEAAIGIPQYSERNMHQWIRPTEVEYNSTDNVFVLQENNLNPKDPTITKSVQSPCPLSKGFQHFNAVYQDDISRVKDVATLALVSCSLMFPSPTSTIATDIMKCKPDFKRFNDTFNSQGLIVSDSFTYEGSQGTWEEPLSSDRPAQKGSRMGMGIHYNPDSREKDQFDDKEEQIVLCFVSLDNKTVSYSKLMIQPEGGFYPALLLSNKVPKVGIDVDSKRQFNDVPDIQLLDSLFHQQIENARLEIEADALHREINGSMLRTSDSLEVTLNDTVCNVKLSAEQMGNHVIQFKEGLTPETPYFMIQIKKCDEDSIITAGVADSNFPLSKSPGKYGPSAGWTSRDGKMWFDEQNIGNIKGHRYGKGDIIAVEVETFREDSSIVLFHKNFHPTGTRYLLNRDTGGFCPTVSITGNGCAVELNIYWQNRLPVLPEYNVMNVKDWCLPFGAKVDDDNCIVSVRDHSEAVCLQGPYSLHKGYNHFEIKYIDEMDGIMKLPPAIALASASPQVSPTKSNFKLHFIRFWPVGEDKDAVKLGDTAGWGIMYPDKTVSQNHEKLVICYLTINRDVVLTRVLFLPPGGFYPLVILPQGVNRVKLEFGATFIDSHPITDDVVKNLLSEAKELLDEEERIVREGKEVDDLMVNQEALLKMLPARPDSRENIQDKKEKKKPKDLERKQNNQDNYIYSDKKVQEAKQPHIVSGGDSQTKTAEKKKKLLKRQSSKSSTGVSSQRQSKSCVIM